MRISITDRCNLHCKYCMPYDIERADMVDILTFEEIIRVVEAGVRLGIVHYRITGGEPLVRKGCAELVRMIKDIKGVQTVTMTTNGILLQEHVKELHKAGLDGINISLDTMDANQFAKMTGKDELKKVLAGIDAAMANGMDVKLNAVVQKGLDWRAIVQYANQKNVVVRFIEMMPIGYGREYVGVSNETLLHQMEAAYGKSTVTKEGSGNGPAIYREFRDLGIKVGFISALHHKFCKDCNRIRLTAKGYLKLCLCYDQGVDLRDILRNKEPKEELFEIMEEAIRKKPLEHCFQQEAEITEEHAMSAIGG